MVSWFTLGPSSIHLDAPGTLLIKWIGKIRCTQSTLFSKWLLTHIHISYNNLLSFCDPPNRQHLGTAWYVFFSQRLRLRCKYDAKAPVTAAATWRDLGKPASLLGTTWRMGSQDLDVSWLITILSWWLNQPGWKIEVKMGIFPKQGWTTNKMKPLPK